MVSLVVDGVDVVAAAIVVDGQGAVAEIAMQLPLVNDLNFAVPVGSEAVVVVVAVVVADCFHYYHYYYAVVDSFPIGDS